VVVRSPTPSFEAFHRESRCDRFPPLRKFFPRLVGPVLFIFGAVIARPDVPVKVESVVASRGIVVAGHPEAAAAGLAILKAGGSAVDAAVATSLALGVAEPYGSGLGGKLVLLHYSAKTGKITVIDAVDAVGSLDVAAYMKRPDDDHSYGYGAVCVPGLTAGLWMAHQKWGVKKWAEDVQPAIVLAREGALVLPKTTDFFEEQEKKLRRGDPEIVRLYLPGGKLPAPGTRLANPDLARMLEVLASQGRDGFYRGEIAEKIVAAAKQGGGVLTLEDFAKYEAHAEAPVAIDFRGCRVASATAARGAPLLLTLLKTLESDDFAGGPLRSVENLDHIGRAWRVVFPLVLRNVVDAPDARAGFERLVSPASIDSIRAQIRAATPASVKKAAEFSAAAPALELAATTHFIVVDANGDIVCATQSLSVHFGAGVVPPGTGIVLNNSMGTFVYADPASVNFVGAGRRPRTAIAPTLVLRDNQPVLALGIPGAMRIPTALLQVLLDRLVLNRPLADAIGDTRFHFDSPWRKGETEAFEAEQSFPDADAAAMRARGWRVVLLEAAGRGRAFGGVNAVEFNPNHTLTGYPDPRRTNAAAGW
jgi:gamma-glutamyltranspeptidase/glutathione hydrolase